MMVGIIRKFFILLVMLVIFVLQPAFASNDYIYELDGIKPFARVPIRVWVQNTAYQDTLYAAFAEWNRASGGCVRFEHAKSENTAQIKVYFVKTLPNNIAGVTYPWANEKNTVMSEIRIAVYPANLRKPITREQAFQVGVHEIGHAIGLQGHSSNRNDIMYPDTSIIGIYASGRDYNTIRRVYCKR